MILHLLANEVDVRAASSDGSELLAQNGVEFLDNTARVLQVVQDLDHVERFLEDLPLVGEVPTSDGHLLLDLLTGADELRVPPLEHLDASLDVRDGLLRLLLEDGSDVDLLADHLADFVGNGLQDVLEELNVVVEVLRDGPDQLETVQERLHRLGDRLELALRDDLELALKGGEELDEILSLELRLREALVLRFILVDDVGGTVLVVLEHVDDLLDGGQRELLGQGVERGRAVRPEFVLALRRQVRSLARLLLFFVDRFRDLLGPVFL